MLNTRRVSIATIFGLIFGFLAWLVASYVMTVPVPWQVDAALILAATAGGFAIGISALRIRWWLHGLLLGLIFSLTFAFALWAIKGCPYEFMYVLLSGLLIGFLIELFASVVFKARAASPPA